MAKNDPLMEKLLLLDRLEELREDLEELGIRSVEALEERIAELEAEVGDEPEEDDGPL